ncbi:hypothetical protein I5R65_22215 [Herbaspirillum sp. AP02]|uniref:hypothetical protein n=1 Tax=unclassified Herbaspirillum TaxID=2624150 RepID=UPI0015DAFB34|nr:MULTISPECIES: hypothetical protein [unclassified Herbaspirillum]MBG7622198.1 hypothetical protein [Herbaspirillum sp. AP02]NZD70430.1 hypothetical protein [Herbaspirillum sp. AP21]
MRRKKIPGLDRIRAEREAAKRPGFFKRNWQYLTSVTIAIGWMLTNSTAVMTNLDELPEKTSQLYKNFLSWHYEDERWSSAWSDEVEGLIGDNPLTYTMSYLRLDAARGNISGEISTKNLCAEFPLSDFAMLQGSITMGKFRGYGWDFIWGVKKKLFAFEMTLLDEDFIEIVPVDDPHHFLPKKMILARLAASGSSHGRNAKITQENYCEKERDEAVRRLNSYGGTQED